MGTAVSLGKAPVALRWSIDNEITGHIARRIIAAGHEGRRKHEASMHTRSLIAAKFRVVAVVVAVVGCLLDSACSPSHGPSQPGPSEAVAVVNGQPVFRSQFEENLERNLRRYGEGVKNLPPAMHARVQQSVLHQLVQQTLVTQRAEELSIRISDQDLDAILQQHKDRFRSEQSFRDYLARANSSLPALREDLRQSVLTDRVIEKAGGPIEIGKQAILAHYEENKDRFISPEQMRLHRLWLPYPAAASETQKRAARAQAHQLRARADKAPPTVFEGICREHSKAAEAARGGDLGLVVPGRFAELDRAIAAGLRVGELSVPLEDHDGIAVFRLDALHPKALKAVSEVEGQIRQALTIRGRNERRLRVLRELESDANVEMRLAFETGVTDAKKSTGAPSAGRPSAAKPDTAATLSSGSQ